jgi:prepilin-type N-terminal cleavage/methylation domain-containing protein
MNWQGIGEDTLMRKPVRSAPCTGDSSEPLKPAGQAEISDGSGGTHALGEVVRSRLRASTTGQHEVPSEIRAAPVRRKGRGFTLLELLVAATILAVSLLAIATAFPVGYRDVVYGGRVSQAVAMAQQKLEELKAGSFPPVGGKQTNAEFTISWSVTSVGFGAATNDLRKIAVTVTWPQSTRTGRYELHGFVSKPY